MEERLDLVERGLVEVKNGLGTLTGRMDSLEAKVDILDGKVGRLAILAEDNKTEVQKLAEGLAGLDQKMDRGFQDLKHELEKDRAMFTAAIRNHGGRMSALERAAGTGEESR